MSNRPWKKRKKQKLIVPTSSNGHVPPAPSKRIENMVQYDILGSQLSEWRNEGWQVVHYQFVSNEHDLPVLAVVMERIIEIIPVPVAQAEEKPEASVDPTPNPSPAGGEGNNVAVPQITIEIPDADREPTLLEKVAKDKPILAALMEHGPDAVKAAMDEQVYATAKTVYDDALIGLDKPIERFQSKLLTTGHVEPDTIAQENIVIEVVLS